MGHGHAGTRALRTVLLAFSISLGLLCAVHIAEPRASAELRAPSVLQVRLLTIDGIINPLTARYLVRELHAAEGAPLIVIRLDTPGGLESSMRQMTQAMLASTVPVVVYVAPPGARAASAGMFLTLAAHVAAMAPGTNIGAAHPVGLGGEGPREGSIEATKVVSDAAALARAIAQARGRNAAWAERAVRESVSITASEALQQHVIDLVSKDLSSLLRALDGRVVVTALGRTTLRTSHASVVARDMTLPERFLHAATDPNIAYLLFTLGLVGLGVELFTPGTFFPGVTGAISLIVAFVAFGSLPVNWAGVALIVLAVALFFGELYVAGFGALGVGATVAFLIGSLLLYSPGDASSPTLPALRVSPWLVATMAALIASFFLFVLRAVVRSRKAPVVTGAQALLGHRGIAVSELSPEGSVHMNGETWRATTEEGPIHEGEVVEVTGVDGVTLQVIRQASTRHGVAVHQGGSP